MKRIKGVFAVVLIILMFASGIWALVYFSKDNENKKIVVTTFPIYDICVNILGNSDDVMLLQDNGVDLHSYKATFQDITAITNSELFIYIGGDSDVWVSDVIRTNENVNMKDLALINYVEVLDESSANIVAGDEHKHEHEGHEHHNECVIDEHIWLSIRNMIKMTEVILDNLIDVFPHFEQVLIENAEQYIAELKELDEGFENLCKDKDTIIVLADRFPFLYLANDYDMHFVSAFSGCSTDAQATFEVKAGLIEIINENQLNYVCKLETSDYSFVNSIVENSACREGVQILELNSCQSIFSKDIAKLSFVEIMKNNLKIFEKVLNNEID